MRDLLDSLYQGFPVGYIIVLRNPDVRLKSGGLSEGKKILIDGQPREVFEVANPAITKDRSWLPDIAPVMRGELTLLKPVRQSAMDNPDADEDQLERVFTRLIAIPRRQIGLIELASDLGIETVTEIFIRINREGVKLSQADSVTSKISRQRVLQWQHAAQ